MKQYLLAYTLNVGGDYYPFSLSVIAVDDAEAKILAMRALDAVSSVVMIFCPRRPRLFNLTDEKEVEFEELKSKWG